MTEDQKISSSTDYLQKFSYRLYEGKIEPRWKRVLNLILFEVISTWRKSIFAKILIIIIFVINFLVLLNVAQQARILVYDAITEEMFRDGLRSTVAGYLSWRRSIILSNPRGQSSPTDIGLNIGLLLIIIFGIAGSGFFADDKYGKVIEIYLSRLQKKEYVIGKLGAIIIYINIFILVPLIVTCIYFVEAAGKDHLNYLDLYFGIIIYSLLCSIILGLFILTLSILVEKRSYASLIFVLVYLFGSIIGGIIAEDNLDNKLFFLISPSIFFVLLAYVCLGDYDLGVLPYSTSSSRIGWTFSYGEIIPLNLNDGYGLEYWHVLIQAFLLILFFSLILTYKIRKMTTEEL